MSSPVIKNSRRIVSSSGGSGGGGGGTVTSVNSGTDITVDNTDPANPIVNFTGTYQDPITVVANYSALPAVGTVTGQFYWCSASQGTKWLPGALGGTYYSAGMYYSNGVTWEFLDVPYNATQAEVNTGTNTDKFVTPATLASATTVIPSTGTTGDIISFSAANTPSRIAAVAAGSYLRSAGTSTLPVWSTLKLPNSATINCIPYATSSNTWGENTGFTFNPTSNETIDINVSPLSYTAIRIKNSVNTRFSGFYADNDIGSYASYIGLTVSNSARAGNQFGSAVANKGSLTSGGASSLGLNIGTVTNNPLIIGTNDVARATITGAGLVTWSAAYHVFAAGTATASTAPIKLTNGTPLTTPEAGALEYITGSFVSQNDGLILGAKALVGTELLSVQKNQNANTDIYLRNTNGSSGALSRIVMDNGTSSLVFGQLGSGWTSSGLNKQNGSALISTGVGGLSFGSTNASGITRFYVGGSGDAHERMRIEIAGVSIKTTSTPTAYLMLGAGTATASTAPIKFTTGTNLTTAEVGVMEYNNTFHLTNSDATRRHIVLAPNTTKVTAGAPYANDGYVVMNIGGTDFKVMTTA